MVLPGTTLLSGQRRARFPLGHAVTLEELAADPYPVYVRLREHEPVTWLDALGMWYVTGYEDAREAMLDARRLTTASDRSTIFDTFGAHMLTSEGAAHDRYRRATQYAFAPAFVRTQFDVAIGVAATRLVDKFADIGTTELRTSFASRLPIQVILLVCGLPSEAEARMRHWYDSFEAALANFAWDQAVRARARASLVDFHGLLDEVIKSARVSPTDTLVGRLANAPASERLSDEEIRRNLSIIFFGGISTVEALLLNCLFALAEHPDTFGRVRQNPALIPQVVDETMRWLSPVQSATRHASQAFEWRGVEFAVGDTVNCMIGAANRDPRIFADPERFDIHRRNLRRHLGFATGAHACLGLNLAKTEARVALEILLSRLPGVEVDRTASEPPTGYEFRQPRRLTLNWKV